MFICLDICVHYWMFLWNGIFLMSHVPCSFLFRTFAHSFARSLSFFLSYSLTHSLAHKVQKHYFEIPSTLMHGSYACQRHL